MHLTMVCPSRNRPAGLLSVITTLEHLSTGNHEITYVLVIDDDDYLTQEQVTHWHKSGFFPERTHIRSEPRTKTVNARFNDAVNAHPGLIYGQICDDAFPMTQHWDDIFSKCANLPAFAWTEANDPNNVTYPAVSETWRATLGRFYPEYFPFWFADTWIAEVYKLAFGHPISVFKQLRMGGRRGHTQGMRDLEFWFRFFAHTRGERIMEAAKLAMSYGEIVDVRASRAQDLEQMQAADRWQLTRIGLYEQAFDANKGEPSEVYKAAKARAEAMMALPLQEAA